MIKMFQSSCTFLSINLKSVLSNLISLTRQQCFVLRAKESQINRDFRTSRNLRVTSIGVGMERKAMPIPRECASTVILVTKVIISWLKLYVLGCPPGVLLE